MSNLEELYNRDATLMEKLTQYKEIAILVDDPNTANLTSINLVLSTYLPSIAKSFAVIADKMCEEEKED